MVLIPLDVLSCAVPMNACVCVRRRRSEVYMSTDVFVRLQFLASVDWLRYGTFLQPEVRVTSVYPRVHFSLSLIVTTSLLRNKNLQLQWHLLR